MFERHYLPCKVLAASFKNHSGMMQHECLEGAYGETAAPNIIKALIVHPSTELILNQFVNEQKRFYGEVYNSIIK